MHCHRQHWMHAAPSPFTKTDKQIFARFCQPKQCYYIKMLLSILEYSTLICLWISICLGRKWAYLNLSCQGVVKEIRIKKHDQNANLCLIIATDSVWPFTDFTSRHNHDTTLTDILNITNVIFMSVNVIELYYISLNCY